MKQKLFILSSIFTLIPIVSFASGDQRTLTIVKNVSQSILQAFSWLAYAIALGVLIVFGIKYVISVADEKANLKNKAPLYLLGMILIATAGTVARFAAKIAGNEDANTVMDVAVELSGLEVGHRNRDDSNNYNTTYVNGQKFIMPNGTTGDVQVYDTDTKQKITVVKDMPQYDQDGNEFLYWEITDANGNMLLRPAGELMDDLYGEAQYRAVYSEGMSSFQVKSIDKFDDVKQDATVFAPDGVNVEYHNKYWISPKLVAPERDTKNNQFLYWLVEEYDSNTGKKTLKRTTDRTLAMPQLEDDKYVGKEYRCFAIYDSVYQ